MILFAGSTQEPEEAVALDVFRRLQPDWPKLRLVLVPRHPGPLRGGGEVAGRLGHRLATSQRIGEALRLGRIAHATISPRVLLVDAVGELGAWWGTAQIAFVGGSLGNRGGQNMIEPAAYGAAVSFGPNTRNFRDIVATMLARRAAVVVADCDALEQFVRRCLEDPAGAAALGGRARELVIEQLGATRRTWDLLNALMDEGDAMIPTEKQSIAPKCRRHWLKHSMRLRRAGAGLRGFHLWLVCVHVAAGLAATGRRGGDSEDRGLRSVL